MSLRRNNRHTLRGVGSGSRVEALEDRIVLAAAALTPGVTFEGTTLKIVTGEGADTVPFDDDALMFKFCQRAAHGAPADIHHFHPLMFRREL